MPDKYFKFKWIRDPLYGFVHLSEKEIKVIDTATFRRLQFIKQLSHSYVVYPSSIQTRFEHSLGTTHVSGIMASNLEFDRKDSEIIRLACLLHDVGHGPFSHLFEPIMRKVNPSISEKDSNVHEEISRIIINEDPNLDSVLNHGKTEVMELLEKQIKRNEEPEKFLQSEIVSSGIDADKLDYLRRDSFHAGVSYGQFDFDRIVQTITSTPNRSRICIGSKGRDAIENYRLARYLMHAQVYQHHARLAADQMFAKALDIAIFKEKVISKDLLEIKARNTLEFLDFYRSLDDSTIYNLIIGNSKARISKEILLNIKKRKLLKRACEFGLKDIKDSKINYRQIIGPKQEFSKAVSEIGNDLKLDSHEIIFHTFQIDNKLYKEKEILLRKKDEVSYLSSDSPIVGKDVRKFLIYGPAEKIVRMKIAERVSELLGVDVTKISDIE